MKDESRAIIKAEEDYRPNGSGFKEAQESFQETMAGTSYST
jgi:hypothetical protein